MLIICQLILSSKGNQYQMINSASYTFLILHTKIIGRVNKGDSIIHFMRDVAIRM